MLMHRVNNNSSSARQRHTSPWLSQSAGSQSTICSHTRSGGGGPAAGHGGAGGQGVRGPGLGKAGRAAQPRRQAGANYIPSLDARGAGAHQAGFVDGNHLQIVVKRRGDALQEAGGRRAVWQQAASQP